MRLHPALAPFKACVCFPAFEKKLAPKAEEVRAELAKYFMVDYDETGSIGKRYRRQDEIGTPLCITIDFETVGDDKTAADGCVTVRDRDTMQQERVKIEDLRAYIEKKDRVLKPHAKRTSQGGRPLPFACLWYDENKPYPTERREFL